MKAVDVSEAEPRMKAGLFDIKNGTVVWLPGSAGVETLQIVASTKTSKDRRKLRAVDLHTGDVFYHDKWAGLRAQKGFFGVEGSIFSVGMPSVNVQAETIAPGGCFIDHWGVHLICWHSWLKPGGACRSVNVFSGVTGWVPRKRKVTPVHAYFRTTGG